jgi:hypothetical protein
MSDLKELQSAIKGDPVEMAAEIEQLRSELDAANERIKAALEILEDRERFVMMGPMGMAQAARILKGDFDQPKEEG